MPEGRPEPDGVFAFFALVLRLLSCDRPPADEGGAPKLTCYYDASPEIVERQLEFRRKRKMDRDNSYTSLASLGVVIDFLRRRIEIQMDHAPRQGTIDDFEENYHHVTFDDGMQLWFSFDLDGLTNSGHAQQMRRDDDGAFSMVGHRAPSRLIS